MTPTAPADSTPRRRLAASLILLLYPLWSHAVIAAGNAAWSLPGLALLVALALLVRNRALPRSPPLLVLLAAIAGAGAVDLVAAVPLALYLPPIVIPALLAWVFARTLLPGRKPLIVRFAEEVMGRYDPEPELARYMRGLTWFWTLLLAALALQALLLALLASPVTWSLFANGINYLIVVAAFVGEFALRCWRFGVPERPSEFWLRLAQTDFRRLG